MSESQIYDVIVIGGGTSGLAAASELIKLGNQNILVLEASDRLGGRIKTAQTSDGIIEIGAQWIHGDRGNPIYKLMKSQNQVDESYDYWDDNLDFQAAYPNGVLQSENKMEPINDILEDLFDSIFENLPSGTARTQSIGNLMDTAVANSQKLKKHDPVLVKALYKSLMTDMRSDYACNSFYDLNAVATSKIWNEDYGGNGNVNLKNGYIKLIEYLASRIPATSIKLNQELTNINWAGNILTVRTRSTTDGSIKSYQAKYIVSSLPLGVLKNSYASLFSPALPADKINAIQRLNFGTVDKIFLVFDKVYFPETADVRFLWPDGYELNLKSSSDPKFYKAFTAFAVAPDRPNVLVTLITGDAAIYSESLSDQQLLNILTELFRNFYPRLNLPVPKLIRSKWNQNPLSKGSYTFVPTGSSIEDVRNLAKPINKKLFFVGEATAMRIGTVHGAYESGLKAAQAIDDLIE